MPDPKNRNVEILLGNPKKALFTFSIPIAVALLIQQSNSIIDSAWVSGLGGSGLAALGIVYPLYAILTGIGNGMGIGVSSAIGRSIGRGDRERASRIGTQSFVLVALLAVVLTPLTIAFAEPLMKIFGAGDVLQDALDYAYPIFISITAVIFSGVISGVLRGEGAVKRSMYVQVAGAVVNLILDPIMIYYFDMGVAGAAWATAISFVVSSILGIYWYCVKKDLFLQFRSADLRYDRGLQKEIFLVGVPETLEFVVMNLFNIGFNICIILVSNTDVMGIYNVCWRIAYIIMIPAQAIGGAVVTACSAEFGMKRFDMISNAFRYAMRSSLIWMVVLSAALALLAPYVATAFTYTPDMIYLHDDLTFLIRVFAAFLPMMAFVFVGSSLLQSMSRAFVAMYSSLARNVILFIGFVFAAHIFGTLISLWAVLFIGELIGGILMGYLAYVILRNAHSRSSIHQKG